VLRLRERLPHVVPASAGGEQQAQEQSDWRGGERVLREEEQKCGGARGVEQSAPVARATRVPRAQLLQEVQAYQWSQVSPVARAWIAGRRRYQRYGQYV